MEMKQTGIENVLNNTPGMSHFFTKNHVFKYRWYESYAGVMLYKNIYKELMILEIYANR